MKNNTRKILLAILVVMTLLVSMATITASAADGNTVYLETGSWNVDNARFAIYTWDGGEQWFDMTDNDGDGIYECTLPAGISNIIFVRLSPDSANSWDNKWSQTADLTLSAGDTFIIDNASGSGHWKSAGSGSGGNSGTTDNGTYTVAGFATLCGSEWSTTDTYNDMTFNAETGLYEKLFTGVPAGYYECKVAADHAWANSWGGTAGEYGTNYAFEITEEKNITITFDPVSKVVSHVESASTGAQERPEPEIDWEDTITVYVGDNSWSTTYVYCWTQGQIDQNAAWPGVEMEWDGEKMLYYYEVPKYYKNIIFNDGTKDGSKTEDMLIPGDGALYDVTTKTWTDLDKYVPPTPPANTTEDITVYVKDAAGWGNVFVYYWGAEGEEPGFAFPGVQMTKGEDGFYYATIPAGYWGITFSNGGDWQDGSLLQTPDLIIPTDGKTGINNTSKTNDWYAVAGNNNSGNNDNTNTPGGSTDGGNDNGDQPAKEMTFLQKLALKLLLFLRSIEDLFKGFFKK